MPDPVHPLQTGELLDRMHLATAHGLACGALRSIATESLELVDQGVRFRIRQVSSLRRKQQAREAQSRLREAGRKDLNPFLPYDRELYVGHLGDDHVALLNKFNVVEQHLLVVTRRFEDQRRLLTAADFTALLWCLREFDGLGFYNGGEEAGASQPHKHLQLVPLPLADDGPPLPLEALLPDLGDAPSQGERLPFVHACLPTPALPDGECGAAGFEAWSRYLRLLEASGLAVDDPAGLQPGPYNLLVTRERMMLVPRSQEHVAGISLNALGYAGSLLVKDATQLRSLRQLGPLAALASGGHPRA